MYLWKHLNKIIPLLKQSTIKILVLDFDGTLSAVEKYPKEAVLPLETKGLLKKLCRKPNLYLTIISGRTLKDIKKKIGLTGIIYGGNHGFEGEILNGKYLFPVPVKMLWAFEKIQKQLKQVSDKFKGTFTEHKGLSLSFHYRLADKKQTPKIKLLVRQILKPFRADDSISTILGKKVIDIIPEVNWNKGYFATMVVKKMTGRVKKHPLVIVIGDDKTDENTFEHIKNGITIVVGKKRQSKAKYFLKNPKEVVKFLQLLNNIM